MKTAISIPDRLFAAAEKTAKKLGIPRSQLFAKAVEEFITNHNPSGVTARIDSLLENQNVSIDPHLAAMQLSTILKDTPGESW